LRALILTASIGEGHDLPARLVAGALRARAADVCVCDPLTEIGGAAKTLVLGASRLDTRVGRAVFEAGHFATARNPAGRRLSERLAMRLTADGLLEIIARERPDVIVSTYPGTTGVAARLRRSGRLAVPLVSAITDLTSLHWWAAPGVDLHLITHPESAGEVRAIAGPSSRVEPVRGLFHDAFLADQGDARARLGLPERGHVVVVSGGGWAVGDLAGAARTAVADPRVAAVVVLCGRRDDVRAALSAALPDVHVWGFTDEMAALLGAATVLIHSTAGLTVLEAQLQGCHVISYGWGGGHIRTNNRAYRRLGIAQVVRRRGELAPALAAALVAGPPAPAWPRHAAFPEAADLIAGLAAEGS